MTAGVTRSPDHQMAATGLLHQCVTPFAALLSLVGGRKEERRSCKASPLFSWRMTRRPLQMLAACIKEAYARAGRALVLARATRNGAIRRIPCASSVRLQRIGHDVLAAPDR